MIKIKLIKIYTDGLCLFEVYQFNIINFIIEFLSIILTFGFSLLYFYSNDRYVGYKYLFTIKAKNRQSVLDLYNNSLGFK